MRRAGYSAARSEGVVGIIELAEINAPDERGLSEKEIDAKVAKMVRSPDPNRVKAGIELYEKRKQRQKEEAATVPEASLGEELAGIITAVPECGAGAFLAMSCFRSNTGNLINFPYLAECAPVVAKNFSLEWQKWRAKEVVGWAQDFIDKLAAGPILEDEQLVAAIKRKSPQSGFVQQLRQLRHVGRDPTRRLALSP